ncbi:MAG: ABC transporter ATP-binding protein, partial [Clostridiales bacterium]|nr:ABC transporter ATP-binding protein [Clostridiales bacterium]
MRRWLKRYNLPIVRRALSLMGSDRKKFVALIVMFCGVELAWTLTEPIGIRGAINALGAADLDAFWRAMPLVAIGKALWWIYAPIAAWGTAKITTGAICQYRADLLHHLLRLPMRFFDARQRGALLTTFDGDMRALERVYDRSFFQVLRSTVGGLANVAVMAAMDWRFALVVLAQGALSIAASGKFARQLKAAGEEQQAGLAQAGAEAHQLVKSAKAIRLFGLQRGHAEQFSTSAGREAAARRRAGAIAARMNAALAAVN